MRTALGKSVTRTLSFREPRPVQPNLRQLIARGWRTGVIAEVEMTMDIPEYSKMKRPGAPRDEAVTHADRDYHANRSRGLGGNPTTGAEENLLGYPGTRYCGEHIFVHEFAHAIMGGGIRNVEPNMYEEIRAAYAKAMAAGKYVHADGRKHYATTNAGEYWAEGVQWWFSRTTASASLATSKWRPRRSSPPTIRC